MSKVILLAALFVVGAVVGWLGWSLANLPDFETDFGYQP